MVEPPPGTAPVTSDSTFISLASRTADPLQSHELAERLPRKNYRASAESLPASSISRRGTSPRPPSVPRFHEREAQTDHDQSSADESGTESQNQRKPSEDKSTQTDEEE